MYKVLSPGSLDKLSLGEMEYRMDNSMDVMVVKMEAISSGVTFKLNPWAINFDELLPFDEGTYNIEIQVVLYYDAGTKKITNGLVTYYAP